MNRKYIGIEKEEEYYEIANKRLDFYKSQIKLNYSGDN